MTDTETETASRGYRIHPLDLLVIALALFLAVVAYTFLFQRETISLPADRFLGKELVLEFEADREWKRTFPAEGAEVLLDDLLVCDVVKRDAPDHSVRVTLRIRDRATQRPDGMTGFRRGIRRGTRLRISDRLSEVSAEVVEVEGDGADD